ncbi:c-type cytochrome [Novosphingobium sp.]|uniref:c-type cytochrome n=1 Tax=Novosphingobium sp. TaxID=1874826 RepID=UPI002FDD4BA7
MKTALLACLLIAMPGISHAQAAVGRRIAMMGAPSGAPPCSACHGTHLEGNPALKVPALAGKPADFIVARLEHYAGPDGHNAQMRQVATALTTMERAQVAAYAAGLKPAAK